MFLGRYSVHTNVNILKKECFAKGKQSFASYSENLLEKVTRRDKCTLSALICYVLSSYAETISHVYVLFKYLHFFYGLSGCFDLDFC